MVFDYFFYRFHFELLIHRQNTVVFDYSVLPTYFLSVSRKCIFPTFHFHTIKATESFVRAENQHIIIFSF